MKFFLTFFDSMVNRPSNKFFLNFFFLKNSFYFNLKNVLFIHFFINLQRTFHLKIIKFNYVLYKNIIFYFIILNVIIQFFIVFILI
jgi:hypothetical protein